MITSKWEFGNDVSDVSLIRRSVGISSTATDEKSMHLVIYDDGSPVGCGSLYFDNGCYNIGSLCVIPQMQKQYLGDLMIRVLLVRGFNMMAEKIRISPTPDTKEFFKKYGFEESAEDHNIMDVTPETLTLISKCGHDCSQCLNKECVR